MSTSSFHSGCRKMKTTWSHESWILIMPHQTVPTLPSALAHRSHTAFRTAAMARWITPFSGPNWTRQEVKMSLLQVLYEVNITWVGSIERTGVCIKNEEKMANCNSVQCYLYFYMFQCFCASSYPSHLAVTGQEAVKSTKVVHNLLQGFPNHQCSQGLHSTHHCRVTSTQTGLWEDEGSTQPNLRCSLTYLYSISLF